MRQELRDTKAAGDVPTLRVTEILAEYMDFDSDSSERPPIMSYLDGAMIPGNEKWLEQNFWGLTGAGDDNDVYVWMMRMPGSTYVTCSCPNTPQAVHAVTTYFARVAEIRQAIVDGRIVLYAQRIEALLGRDILSYEILVRLVDVNGEIYTPDRFLPAAERFGEAISIDRLVITMALRKLADNPAHLHALDLCHLNVSAQSIANPDFRKHVANQLDITGVPPAKLCFELTETAAIGNMTRAREFIDEMRSRGCKIALDDFGSGMASFAYLKTLPVDVLKIDGVFVRDLANNEVDPVLVRSMGEVARSLGKTTVAEWVEDRALIDRLRELGVDQAQGYGIHEPCALSELIGATPILKAAGNF